MAAALRRPRSCKKYNNKGHRFTLNSILPWTLKIKQSPSLGVRISLSCRAIWVTNTATTPQFTQTDWITLLQLLVGSRELQLQQQSEPTNSRQPTIAMKMHTKSNSSSTRAKFTFSSAQRNQNNFIAFLSNGNHKSHIPKIYHSGWKHEESERANDRVNTKWEKIRDYESIKWNCT